MLAPPPLAAANPVIAARFQWAARLSAVAVAALGAAVLVGWAFDLAALKSLLPGLATMKANTALAFLLAGAALGAADREGRAGRWRRPRLLLAGAVAALALATLGQDLAGVDFAIDQLFFADDDRPVGTPHPGRMAPMTALGLALAGIALLLLDRRAGHGLAQVPALAACAVGLLGLVGYAYSVEALYGLAVYGSMAVHSAAGLVVLSLGIVFVRPQHGVTAILCGDTSGGALARRLLPVALAAPFLLGWLQLTGQGAGHFGSEFGAAVLVLSQILLFSLLILATAGPLHESDRRRLAAEAAARESQATLIKNQAQLAGIIASAMDAIITVDSEQRIVLFNAAAEAMFGYRAGDILGRPLAELLPARFRDAHAGFLDGFARTHVSARRMGAMGTVSGLRAGGEEFPIEASISQLETDHARYFTVILRDVTERVRADEALRALAATLEWRIEERTAELAAARDAADCANRAKSDFLANMSHELRTPLNSMLSLAYLQALNLEGNLTPKQVEHANITIAAGRDLLDLINDLLDLAAIEAGKVILHAAPTALAGVGEDMEQLFRPLAMEKGLVLSATLAPDVPASIVTDGKRLYQILRNLLANALKFTQAGEVALAITRAGDDIAFTVADTGIGIPADQLDTIFDAFHQVDNSFTRSQGGTGLGLSICTHLAALLGGRLTVDSQVGAGSRFAFLLPIGGGSG